MGPGLTGQAGNCQPGYLPRPLEVTNVRFVFRQFFFVYLQISEKTRTRFQDFFYMSITYLFHIFINLFIYSNSLNSNSEGHPGQNNRRTDYSPDTTTKDLPYHDRGGSTGGSIPAPTGPAGQHQQQHQPSFLAYKAGEVLTTGNLTDFLKPYYTIMTGVGLRGVRYPPLPAPRINSSICSIF